MIPEASLKDAEAAPARRRCDGMTDQRTAPVPPADALDVLARSRRIAVVAAELFVAERGRMPGGVRQPHTEQSRYAAAAR